MKPTLRFATALLALLALASPAAAQQTHRTVAARASEPPPQRPRPRRRPRQTRRQAAADSSWKKGRPITIQYYRAAGQARHQRVRDDQGAGRRVHRLQARLRRGVHLAGAEPVAPQHRRAERRERRQRQPARRHRLRLQQLDGEPGAERAARARHPRRADQLPVVAAPQRDLGEGRLHPDRPVADRLRAAEDAVRDRHRARRPHGDQLRRRALPPQRQRQRDLQPVRRQLHHGRVHHRDRRRGLPQDRRRRSRWARSPAARFAARC